MRCSDQFTNFCSSLISVSVDGVAVEGTVTRFLAFYGTDSQSLENPTFQSAVKNTGVTEARPFLPSMRVADKDRTADYENRSQRF
jgi:hypothetical protein